MGNVAICKAHRDCFANRDGACACLKNNDFGRRDCPFYKTADAVKKEQGGSKRKGDAVYGNQQI